MPATLYESVKQSVVEYEQLKKMNETSEDKQLFRWKLVTILLAIVFIVLVGVFSQLLKSINNLPDERPDKSFIVPLLATVNPSFVPTLTQANFLLKGVYTAAGDGEHHL